MGDLGGLDVANGTSQTTSQWYTRNRENSIAKTGTFIPSNKSNFNTSNQGDKTMTGERNIQMGSGDYHETNINDQGSYVEGDYYHNSAEKQNLADAANEIQQLLEQLSQNNPTNTMTGNIKIAGEVIEQIETNPALMNRVFSALKAGGVSAFKQILNHPAASFVIDALEEWQNTKIQGK
ncbi:hypothetical protein [Okeania sp. KiyG1]|uniref:hypothetical protein n=1 Tax=Okeania sp. KiyG1 TaxID=2720165 RepID=UPI001F307CFA|nr:hypothetical protein [Okeania sp. KiyG1]